MKARGSEEVEGRSGLWEGVYRVDLLQQGIVSATCKMLRSDATEASLQRGDIHEAGLKCERATASRHDEAQACWVTDLLVIAAADSAIAGDCLSLQAASRFLWQAEEQRIVMRAMLQQVNI
ncbi:MAG: hypothetical protein FRX49_13259 [Trebouxia sp. A1-2]|nr:MAG: hypothetical protein FRX49_13259 [Trebouxia sp. A1-2]